MNDDFDSPCLRTLTPYTPGEQLDVQGLVKLNTNENPYPPSPAAIAAMVSAVSDGLELYPDPDSRAVREAVAQHHGLSPGEVFVGNGSDEVLAHAFCAFFQQGDAPLLFADVTYSFYEVYCRLYGIRHELIPVGEDLGVSVDRFLARRTTGTGIAGMVIANPNAPTGECLPLSDIERLASAFPQRVLLVDEAYVDFGGQTATPLVRRYPNLLVVQTLSKSRSLAGLRVGYAIGSEALIGSLRRVKDSFNSYPVGRVAQAGAAAAINDRSHFDSTTQAVIASRETMATGLALLEFEVLASKANFLFARHPRCSAENLAAQLREHKILVRHFLRPRIHQFLRISVGTDEQVTQLLRVLRQLVDEPHLESSATRALATHPPGHAIPPTTTAPKGWP